LVRSSGKIGNWRGAGEDKELARSREKIGNSGGAEGRYGIGEEQSEDTE
jgi:hypothetical protein